MSGAVQYRINRLVYIASKVLPMGAAFGLPPAMPKPFTLLTATAGLLPARMRGREVPSATARNGLSVAPTSARKDAIEPAILGALDAGRARFHVVLGVEVRACLVGRAGGVDNRQVPLVPERL